MLILDPKTPHRSAPARTGRRGARRAARHVAGIERLLVERLAGIAGLISTLMARRSFPKAQRLMNNTLVWDRAEIHTWLASKQEVLS